jgi:hypothetical protein
VKILDAIRDELNAILLELQATHKAIDELALKQEETEKKKKYEEYTSNSGLYGRGKK